MNLDRKQATVSILAMSLAANCFLAGLLVGHRAPPPFMGHHGGPPMMGPPGMMLGLEDALPPADAGAFHDAMRQLPPLDTAEDRQSMGAIADALRAKAFDADAFHAALQHVHDQHTAKDKAFVEALTKAASDISPEGRAKLADIIGNAPLPGGVPPEGGPPPRQ